MKRLIHATAARLRNVSPLAITALGLAYELGLGLLDYSTPEEMSFTIFYLLGVAFVGWGAGARSAVLVSAVSAGIMMAHERAISGRDNLGFGFSLWNASTRFFLFCAAGWLTAEITRLNRHLQKLVAARTVQLAAETDKHRATSAQLGQALARLKTIIANVPLVIFAADRNGMLSFEDGRALNSLGVKPGARVGQSMITAYGQSSGIREHMRRALSGEEFSATVELGPVTLETWYSATRDADGSISGCTGVAFNVTDQRRLERQILEISDREQARLGQEIHDGLCQQLVSLAFDANSLEGELASRKQPQAATAARIAKFLDQAITESRQLARGLFPIRLEAQGLPSALEELAKATRERFGVACRFESNEPALIETRTIATHLYRIAQEAVANAIKHGKARSIVVRLQALSGQLQLEIEDDGLGISPAKLKDCPGMGLHIMDYRARAIGGGFSCAPRPQGGTLVCCCMPVPSFRT